MLVYLVNINTFFVFAKFEFIMIRSLVTGTWSETHEMYHGEFFWSWHMIMCTLRIHKIKIGNWEGFELGPFFSLFLMRKCLSSGQKGLLMPHFPQIRGIFVCRVVLDFCFRKRKRALTQNSLNSWFWSFVFLMYTSSCASFKKIHRDTFHESHSIFLPLVRCSIVWHSCKLWLHISVKFQERNI